MSSPSPPQDAIAEPEPEIEATVKLLRNKFATIPPFRKSVSSTICAALLIPAHRRNTLQALLDAGELDYETFTAADDNQS